MAVRLRILDTERETFRDPRMVAYRWRVRPLLASIGVRTGQNYRELKLRTQRF